MDLFYNSPKGKDINWPVSEVVPGLKYRIVDVNGEPNPQGVQVTEGRSHSTVFFDGFIIENGTVYATSLLTNDPKIEVGHSPRIG
jgi:hypothetical protein